MANNDDISSDPAQDRVDLVEAQRESGTAPGGGSSLLNVRTIAAGMAGAVVTALVLGAVVLFLRSDDNAPIQVLLSTRTPSGDSTSAANLGEDLKVYVTGAVAKPGCTPCRLGAVCPTP